MASSALGSDRAPSPRGSRLAAFLALASCRRQHRRAVDSARPCPNRPVFAVVDREREPAIAGGFFGIPARSVAFAVLEPCVVEGVIRIAHQRVIFHFEADCLQPRQVRIDVFVEIRDRWM